MPHLQRAVVLGPLEPTVRAVVVAENTGRRTRVGGPR